MMIIRLDRLRRIRIPEESPPRSCHEDHKFSLPESADAIKQPDQDLESDLDPA
jgi:hypothetical protein